MKTVFKFAAMSLLLLAVFACASGDAQKEPAASGNSLTLDGAIGEAVAYFVPQLSQDTKLALALLPFDSPTGRLSDYVFEELWSRFEDSNKFVMVDRRNLQRIEAELSHQYESGKVADSLAVSVSKQYGARILVYGQITALGKDYRMTVYATDVEKASSRQRAFVIRSDSRLAALLNASLDDEVERAVSSMAGAINQKTIIAVGRISYGDTQTVSNLSAWLKNSIVANAQKRQDKFQVASDRESADFAIASRGITVVNPGAVNSAIQAVVLGTYSPLDKGAEVLIQLVSTSGNRIVLASSKFLIPASELERRKLSLLPEKDSTTITKAEFDAKQKAIDPYAGKNNKWAFTVTPEVLDGIYRDNDLMYMRIYSERDCYFRIIHVDVNGSTQVIYPVSPSDNNFIRGGQTRRLPDNTQYRMGPPYGEELILAAAYDRPFAPSQSGPFTLSAEAITRGLVVESDNRAAMSPSATAKFSYTILPR